MANEGMVYDPVLESMVYRGGDHEPNLDNELMTDAEESVFDMVTDYILKDEKDREIIDQEAQRITDRTLVEGVSSDTLTAMAMLSLSYKGAHESGSIGQAQKILGPQLKQVALRMNEELEGDSHTTAKIRTNLVERVRGEVTSKLDTASDDDSVIESPDDSDANTEPAKTAEPKPAAKAQKPAPTKKPTPSSATPVNTRGAGRAANPTAVATRRGSRAPTSGASAAKPNKPLDVSMLFPLDSDTGDTDTSDVKTDPKTGSADTDPRAWGGASKEHQAELDTNPEYKRLEAAVADRQRQLARLDLNTAMGKGDSNTRESAERELRIVQGKLMELVNEDGRYDEKELAVALALRDIVERDGVRYDENGEALPSYKAIAAQELLESKHGKSGRVKKVLKVAGYVGMGGAAIVAGVSGGAVAGAVVGGTIATKRFISRRVVKYLNGRISSGSGDRETVEQAEFSTDDYENTDTEDILRAATAHSAERSSAEAVIHRKEKRKAIVRGMGQAAAGALIGAGVGAALGTLNDVLLAADQTSLDVDEIVRTSGGRGNGAGDIAGPSETAQEVIDVEPIPSDDFSDMFDGASPNQGSGYASLDEIPQGFDGAFDTELNLDTELTTPVDISSVLDKPEGYIMHGNGEYTVTSEVGSQTDSIWRASESILENRLGRPATDIEVNTLTQHFIDQVPTTGPEDHIAMGQVMNISDTDLNEVMGLEANPVDVTGTATDAQAVSSDFSNLFEGTDAADSTIDTSDAASIIDTGDAQPPTASGAIDTASEGGFANGFSDIFNGVVEKAPAATADAAELSDRFQQQAQAALEELTDRIDISTNPVDQISQYQSDFETYIREQLLRLQEGEITDSAYEILKKTRLDEILENMAG